ncbi:MAG: hypothetical protein GF320_01790 [Armatimonadia bacterium]|nr:hypothetical protein [Armatimonadia bacterium]
MRNPWHSLREVAPSLDDDMMGFTPVPKATVDWKDDYNWSPDRPVVRTPRAAMIHAIGAAGLCGDRIADRTKAHAEKEWDRIRKRPPTSSEGLIKAVGSATRRLQARARRLDDDDLTRTVDLWGVDAPLLLVLFDGGLLHTAWHLGQVSLMAHWHKARNQANLTAAAGKAPKPPKYPGRRSWAPREMSSPTEMCLHLLHAAYEESPWHSLKLMLKGVTKDEMNWHPYPWGLGVDAPIYASMVHAARSKVVDGETTFGKGDLEDAQPVLGEKWWDTNKPAPLLKALDLAHEYLMELVEKFPEGEWREHRPVRFTRQPRPWKAISTLATLDSFLGGRISLVRDAYTLVASGAA